MKKQRQRTNEAIKVDKVFLIGLEGEQMGVISIQEALEKAKQANMDLVEVSPNATPPVCKILDYNRHQFQKSKKKTQQVKGSKREKVRVMMFRPVIDVGDYQVKCRKIKAFLESGDKVRAVVRFRGREVAFEQKGYDLLERIKEDVADLAQVDNNPKLEGKQIVMLLTPKKT
jgi:translation initiation factor IF-3